VKIEATEAFERALQALSGSDFDVVAPALRKLPRAFGNPDARSGVRKLRGQIYEMRAGLGRRIVFRKEPDRLFLLLLGNHVKSAAS
jgi:hypothetical protein